MKKWSPEKIEHWPTTKLVPYAINARTHTDAQVAQIAASIAEFGFTNPILAGSDGVIVAGHGRLAAAQKLGLDVVPVVILDHLTPTQRRALVIADNRIAEKAGWDNEILSLEFDDLSELGFDLDLTGFSADEIAALMPDEPPEGLTDDDAVPDVPADAISKPGDIWLLGKHRVMCGDSTSIESVESVMAGGRADMVFTDPPYGMSYGGGRAGKVGSTDGTVKKFGVIKGDEKTGDDLISLVRDALASSVVVSKAGAASYICFPWRTYSEFKSALNECGLIPSSCIVWDKKSIGLGNANYRPQHEFIFYCKGGAWYGDKAQSDVWYISRGATGDYVHPTQKPVELIERALINSSKGGDTVLDVFGGSGSTLIACEKTGREARVMELDPKYVDVIVRRWQDWTGKQATRESDGATFCE